MFSSFLITYMLFIVLDKQATNVPLILVVNQSNVELFIILFTVFCYHVYIPAGIDIVNLYLSDINVSFNTIVIICIYFALGYTLYAFLNAIAGATVNKAEEVQTASLPLYFISMISFYLSIFTIDSSSDKLNNFVQMFPLSSPFSMPAKVVAGLYLLMIL